MAIDRLTISDFCKEYGVSLRTFYRLREAGAVRVVYVNRKPYVLRQDAEAWANNLPETRV